MKSIVLSRVTAVLLVIIAARAGAGEAWWPHPVWGPGDEAGASNWIDATKIRRAVTLVKKGNLYELGHIYEAGMPVPMNRPYAMELIGPLGPFGDNNLVMFSEHLETEIGQVGTQFDGLGHVGKMITGGNGAPQMTFYNGFTLDEMYSKNGLKKLGIEKIRPIITRGILVDLVKYKGADHMPGSYEVTLKDVFSTLAAEGFSENTLEPGDAVLLRLGGRWDDSQYGPGPGIGMEVAQWLVGENISVLGSDKGGEVSPNPDPKLVFPLHQELMMKNGIFNLESMDLEAIARDGVYEFLFIFTPLRVKGATGSPGRPIAIN